MKTPTFREQYDKIVGAYMRDELKPFMSCACFIGNLMNNSDEWSSIRTFKFGVIRRLEGDSACRSKNWIESLYGDFYKPEEIIELEALFLITIHTRWHDKYIFGGTVPEDDLFNAMSVTLEALKKLHESKGEIIEDYVFEKRQLVNI